MGRAPCCQKIGLKRGRWTAEEDEILIKYIRDNGEGSWRSLPKNAGLLRCGKSCRLRWINYLRTDLKRGNISPQEEDLIIKLHATLGNRWSLIASQLSGRTDNEIKNHWNSHLRRSIDAWRRPVNDTLPQHILDNLAKLMAKPSPSTLIETKKNAPKIKDTEKNPTTDESIFSSEDQQDPADVAGDYGGLGLPSLNEMVSHLGQLLMPQSHATTEILNLNLNPGAINLELMNDLSDLGPSHAETGSSLVPTRSSTMDTTEPSLSSPYTFDQLMNMSDEWSWEDYTQPAGQDLMNHEVGRFMSWSLDFDDVGSWDCQNG